MLLLSSSFWGHYLFGLATKALIERLAWIFLFCFFCFLQAKFSVVLFCLHKLYFWCFQGPFCFRLFSKPQKSKILKLNIRLFQDQAEEIAVTIELVNEMSKKGVPVLFRRICNFGRRNSDYFVFLLRFLWMIYGYATTPTCLRKIPGCRNNSQKSRPLKKEFPLSEQSPKKVFTLELII